MKNRGIIIIMLALLAWPPLIAQEATGASGQASGSDKVEVYYFHFERRCATCVAVETETEKALQELYPEQLRSGAITFRSVNLEDESNDALAEKLGVDGQSLLVVKDGRQENLTNVAFMHAGSNPDKLRKAIRESVGNP